MACYGGGGGGCGSNCYKEEEDGGGEVRVEEEQKQQRSRSKCYKCKEGDVARDGCLGLCSSCFRSSLYSKFKLAVTSHSMISPSDNILVAYSGGHASRVVLQFVHELQYKAHMNLVASKDRSLPVFRVGVAFIDETAILGIPSSEVEVTIEEIKSIVSSLAPPAKCLHITPIGHIFSPDVDKGRRKVSELLESISDTTGSEDLVQYLRMLCLQKIALENGFNKLILGSCASKIACHVISATVKGQGYSLPADVQYVDARNPIPVLLPLRDCLARELKMLCSLDCLKTQPLFCRPYTGINGLVSSFVTLLQEENPSRESTIVRTAEKLSPFCFNKLPETSNNHDLPTRRRQKSLSVKSNASIQVDTLCPICNSPLNSSDLSTSKNKCMDNQTRGNAFAANCCTTCCFQILPKEPSSRELFYTLLPELMTRRVGDGDRGNQSWLREQIKDFLLSDEDDGT